MHIVTDTVLKKNYIMGRECGKNYCMHVHCICLCVCVCACVGGCVRECVCVCVAVCAHEVKIYRRSGTFNVHSNLAI